MHIFKMYSTSMVFITLLMAVLSCTDQSVIDTETPSNLTVKISTPETEPYVAIIEASANHAIEYQLRIDKTDLPAQSNTTGVFSHTFTEEGTWHLDIRAYGSSGRYIRKVLPIEIIIEIETPPVVTVDMGYFSSLSYEGYELIWNDEFEGNAVNTDYWEFEIGDGCPNLCGWGNNEWQYYRSQNAWVEDGVLTIEARRENAGNRNFTSARMKTQGKKYFKYGRIDIRALLPKGQGIWPALWMLGENITNVSWPASGEIDIMEMIGGGGRENQVHGTVHWDANGHAQAGGSYTLASGTFADEYHVFTIIWDQNLIRWFVNDIQFYQINITPGHMTEFHEEFFFLFNVAVGGRWPGYPDDTTIFPQQMKVDYIRVFQKSK